MLDIKINKGTVNARVEGTGVEICADCLVLLHAIFHRFYEKDVMQAIMFRAGIERHLEDAFSLSNEEVMGND